jgi:alanyl-tRNA synthetase
VNSSQIRQSFIDFFKSKGHTFVPGAPIVPDNDPSLLFINAGMNQFKDVFLGQGKREYVRAVNSQICVRVSGKHNDLEDVGRDTTHQTSFEMLGNWSFGDYYKKESIEWAWEYLTTILKLKKERLYVTIFEDDEESGALWKAHTDVNPAHIVTCGKKDNFWEMGDVGPCGPCTEIHIDLDYENPNRTPDADLSDKDLDGDRFIELWNLVFIQYNREKNGDLTPLAQTHVDTGAGLERLASVLNGSLSNYKTETFEAIIKKIEAITGVEYTDDLGGMSHRVVADHVRTIFFGIADNVLPANEGRGYVLRRLLRRALRYARKLNYSHPLLFQLVDTVSDILGDHFEHLKTRKEYIKTVIKAEEDSFLKTLELGLIRFEELMDALKKENKHVIPGEEAFKLYDTFGFPVDLTEVMADEMGLSVDMDGFTLELNKQRQKSRTATKAKKSDGMSGSAVAEDEATAVVNDEILALLYQTEYTDNVARGGESRVLKDSQARLDMARHHTGTHILHEALRHVLGEHVHQAGSSVDTNRLRFDFTHFSSLSEDELSQVQRLCNETILEDMSLSIQHMTLDDAKKTGAAALFGEKYDADDVRIVKIGDFSLELCGGTHVIRTGLIEELRLVSETAVAAGTRRIEAVAGSTLIKQYETDIKAKVIDQIKAKKERLDALLIQLDSLGLDVDVPNVDAEFAATVNDLNHTHARLLDVLKMVEKILDKEKSKEASQNSGNLLEKGVLIAGTDSVMIKHCFDGYDMKMLHTVSDDLVNREPNAVVIFASNHAGKGVFLVKCGRGVDTSLFNAREIIQSLTAIAGGGGGGNAEKAQAGGAKVEKLDAALSKLSW